MASVCHVSSGQWLACSDAKLPLDQIEAGDHFSDRMFDLQTRIDFHEVEIAAGCDDEFHGACVDVIDGFGCRNRGGTHRLA